MKTVSYTGDATRQLARLPPGVREQVIAKIHRYAETGAGQVKALVGQRGARLRIGEYRAIFNEARETILVVAVGHRREIYR